MTDTTHYGRSGYLSGNRLIDYPLADGQSVPLPDDRKAALMSCVVDAMIYVADFNDTRKPRICNISSDGSMLRLSVAMGSDMIPVSVSWSSSGKQYPVVSGHAPWGVYTIVFSSEGIRDLGVLELIFPSSAVSDSSPTEEGLTGLYFASRVVSRPPFGLRSIRVFDGVQPRETGPHFIISGDVQLRPGNNILLEDPSNVDGSENGIGISAIPGAGMGVIPCRTKCRTVISPLKCEDGHVRLFNDTCYDLEPSTGPKAGYRPGYIKIHAKCTACCTCDMYASIVNDRLASIFSQVKEAKASISDMVEKYELNVKKFNDRIDTPTGDDVYVSLTGTAIGKNLASRTSEVKGTLDRGSFRCVIRNDAFSSVTILFEYNRVDGAGRIGDTSLKTSGGLSRHVDGPMTRQAFVLAPGEYANVDFIVLSDTYTSEAGAFSARASVRVRAEFGGAVIGTYDRSATA